MYVRQRAHAYMTAGLRVGAANNACEIEMADDP